MMNARRLLLSIPVSALALTLIPLAAPAATTPAITAFDEAFAKVNDYTVTVRAHEVKGDRVQDRTYHYWFKRPNLAKTLIVSGDGNGSGGVWNGGDKVSGHQGGMLSFIHLKVDLHDPRATSLRGYTIPEGLLQNEVDKYREIKGTLTQRNGPEVDGAATDEVDLTIADPSANDNITRASMYLSKQTHFPVRQVRWEGDKIVADDFFTDLKTNVGLADSDFPF
jgi:outer membrane lipoprotein-sorting protein